MFFGLGRFLKPNRKIELDIVIKKDCKVYLYENKNDWCEFSLPSDPVLIHDFMILFKDIANIIMGANKKKWLKIDVASSIMAINGSKDLFDKFSDCIKFNINGRDYYLRTLGTNNPTYFFACYRAVAEWFKSYHIIESFSYYIKPLYKEDIMALYQYAETIAQSSKSGDEMLRMFLEDKMRGGK